MKKRTRRQVLRGMGALVGAAAAGCGRGAMSPLGEEGGTNLDDPFERPKADPGEPTPAPTPELSPAELLAGIDTFVVLCMENRSFDHFFGSLKLIEGRPVNGLTGAETNLTVGGVPVSPYLLEDFTPEDPPHGWDSSHAQWNQGAMDGFVKEHAGADEAQVMGYHVRSQLPAIYGLADEFALCDAWHCSVLGPTWPNRFYLHNGTSGGLKSNTPLFGATSVFNLLADAGVPARTYFHDLPFQGGYFNFENLAGIEQFFADAATGSLPAFTLIDPKFQGADANDDHPDHDVQLGQALIASIYAALAQSPQWDRMMFVITYDEHGGFYDHAPPPVTSDERADFRQLGVRVPGVVAGPQIRPGAIVSNVFEHVSILSTLTTRFGLAPLNQRVSAAKDLSACIDPSLIMAPRRAPVLAPLRVSKSAVRRLYERPVVKVNHPELGDLADRREIPRHLDRRAEGRDVTARVLAAGAKLGALRIVD